MTEAVVPDFLIAEAKQRRRRRRLGYLAALVVGVAALVGGWFGTRGVGSGSPSQQAVAAARAQIEAVGRRSTVVEAGLGGGVGWAMDGYGIWLSANDGRSWRTVTPPHVVGTGDAVARINQVEFIDGSQGWIVAGDVVGGFKIPPGSASVRHAEIDRTFDGGKTWQAAAPPGCLQSCGDAHVSFLDPRDGYALEGVEAGARLFSTSDAGATWTAVARVPFRGSIQFVDADVALGVSDPSRWTAAQDSVPIGGGRLFRTVDGGRTWRRIDLAGPKATADSIAIFGSTVVVPVRTRVAKARERLAVYVSHDAGATWTALRGPAPGWFWKQNWGIPDASQFSAATANDWVVAGGSLLHTTDDAGRTWRTIVPLDLPPHSTFWEVHFASALDGWAIVRWKGLEGAALVQTSDGGRWWTPLAPPVPKPKPLPKRIECGSSCARP